MTLGQPAGQLDGSINIFPGLSGPAAFSNNSHARRLCTFAWPEICFTSYTGQPKNRTRAGNLNHPDPLPGTENRKTTAGTVFQEPELGPEPLLPVETVTILKYRTLLPEEPSERETGIARAPTQGSGIRGAPGPPPKNLTEEKSPVPTMLLIFQQNHNIMDLVGRKIMKKCPSESAGTSTKTEFPSSALFSER